MSWQVRIPGMRTRLVPTASVACRPTNSVRSTGLLLRVPGKSSTVAGRLGTALERVGRCRGVQAAALPGLFAGSKQPGPDYLLTDRLPRLSAGDVADSKWTPP